MCFDEFQTVCWERELYSALLIFSMHVFILFILIKFQAKKA